MISWRAELMATSLLCAVSGTVCAVDSKAANEDVCRVEVGTARLAGLAEASGVSLSKTSPKLLWSHNDSGKPLVFSVDASGSVGRRVQVTGATVDDWEDLSLGSCPGGSCLFVADIGDNNRARREVVVYRVPEPRAQDSATAQSEALVAVYPDGAHDAEAAFVTADGRLFIITKERPSVIYRSPRGFGDGSVRLERVAPLPLDLVTDAEVSPDGNWVVVRSNDELAFFRTQGVVSGKAEIAVRFDLRALKEPQGEGVTLDSDGTVYLVGEGGGRNGTFARLRCALPS